MAVALDPKNQALTLSFLGDQATRDANGQIMVPENLSFNKPNVSGLATDFAAKGNEYGRTNITNSAGDVLGAWAPQLPGKQFTGNSKRDSYVWQDLNNPSWMKQNAPKFQGGYLLDKNEMYDPNSYWTSNAYRGQKKQEKGFLGNMAPAVGLASMFIPGMQGIGAGLMAANAASTGNWGGVLAAGLPYIPGVSDALGGASSWLGNTLGVSGDIANGLTYGLAGGLSSAAFGGDFLQGALTSGLSSASAPAIKDWFGQSGIGDIFNGNTNSDYAFSLKGTNASSDVTPDSTSQSMSSVGAGYSPTELRNPMSFNSDSMFPMSETAMNTSLDSLQMPQSGGGMSPDMSWIKGAKLLSGLYGDRNNTKIADQLKRQAQGMDPFGSQRGQYQDLLSRSYSDPFGAPEFSRLANVYSQQIAKQMAAKGLRGNPMQSKAMLQDMMTSQLNKYRESLMAPAGANIGPGAGSNLYTQAAGLQKGAADNLTGGLSALFDNRIDPKILYAMLSSGGGGLSDLASLMG